MEPRGVQGMWRGLWHRELGAVRPERLSNKIYASRLQSLDLSSNKEFVTFHKGINSLQIDQTEYRYLLAGATDGSVAIFDTLQPSDIGLSTRAHQHERICYADKTSPQGHQYAVSSVQWYPIDTGIFVTGSFDHNVNVWDTNTLQVASQFKMGGKVYAVGMSQISAHTLLAVGTEGPNVRLCDLSSGAFTHTLSGHRDSVWALVWSISNEYVLMTGSCDGAIRFWDIRRAGSFKVLDQQNTQTGRRPPIIKKSISGESERKRSSPGDSSRRDPGKAKKATSNGSSSKSSAAMKVPVNSATPRVHPGMASSANRAAAHYGIVTALVPTPKESYLVSAGTDSRVRLWDVESGRNTLVNYEATRIRGNKGMQLAVSSDSSLLFVPEKNVVKAYDMWTGQLQKTLRGHYDVVNCCVYHPTNQVRASPINVSIFRIFGKSGHASISEYDELYSGSNDHNILVWSPVEISYDADEEESPKSGNNGTQPDEDAWSD